MADTKTITNTSVVTNNKDLTISNTTVKAMATDVGLAVDIRTPNPGVIIGDYQWRL